MDCAILRC